MIYFVEQQALSSMSAFLNGDEVRLLICFLVAGAFDCSCD